MYYTHNYRVIERPVIVERQVSAPPVPTKQAETSTTPEEERQRRRQLAEGTDRRVGVNVRLSSPTTMVIC